MESDLQQYIMMKEIHCVECNGIAVIKKLLMPHIFIETDYYAESHSYALQEFPTQLHINDDRYIYKIYYNINYYGQLLGNR